MLLGAALLRIVFLFRSLWKQANYKDRQQQLALELLRQRLQVAKARVVDREHQESSWGGYRKFVVQKIVKESSQISSFYLYPHDKKRLPPFKPGQHLTFKLRVPDVNKPVIRCYSLSDAPTQYEWYRISIKQIPPPSGSPDVPPGLVSNYFHNNVNEGDILDVKAPGGKFFLETEEQFPVVLLAGGIGLTPLLSMVNTVTARQSMREIWLFYGVRNPSELIMKEHLLSLHNRFPTLHFFICYSDPRSTAINEEECGIKGNISITLLQKVLPSNNYEFYLCGPPPMMESLVTGLKEWGVPEERILFEAFGPASVKRTTPASVEPASQLDKIQVAFTKSGKSLSWDSKAESLLDFAEMNGISVEFGCRAGSCGTCLTAVKSGEVRYQIDPGEKPETGSCLMCISTPKGDIVLDA